MPSESWFVETEDQLKQTLSELPAFQTFAGVATQPEAFAKIFTDVIERDDQTKEIMLPSELLTKRPLANLWSRPSMWRAADSNALGFGGIVTLDMEINISQILERDATATTLTKQMRWAKESFGKILITLFEAWEGLNRVVNCGYYAYDQTKIAGDLPHVHMFADFSYGPNE